MSLSSRAGPSIQCLAPGAHTHFYTCGYYRRVWVPSRRPNHGQACPLEAPGGPAHRTSGHRSVLIAFAQFCTSRRSTPMHGPAARPLEGSLTKGGRGPRIGLHAGSHCIRCYAPPDGPFFVASPGPREARAWEAISPDRPKKKTCVRDGTFVYYGVQAAGLVALVGGLTVIWRAIFANLLIFAE